MEIIPAIDLQNGEAVRLYKGDYDKKTVYSKNPLEIAQKFEQMGAKYLHLVDLDGAKLGQTRNLEIVRKIKDQTNLKIEIGGGIRNLDTVSLYLEQIGVERVILGTAAAEKPDFLKELLNLAFNALWLRLMPRRMNRGLALKFISKVGEKITKTGYDLKMLNAVCSAVNIPVIASGGCGSISDIIEVFEKTKSDAALVASLFHYGEATVDEVKEELIKNRIPARIIKKEII
ncbi:HisA/HisF-related TIM barrel protein [Lactococcus cremoris]|uniref:HisA/HisF-related TIM barrel protein n=1 Tax=Lactococcus lactis subsp. cremoris TaxID=1359 RepID=UPI0024A765F0|nr:HisA/HisF-related TIM barrel protein [Lactococcus cremoris]